MTNKEYHKDKIEYIERNYKNGIAVLKRTQAVLQCMPHCLWCDDCMFHTQITCIRRYLLHTWLNKPVKIEGGSND